MNPEKNVTNVIINVLLVKMEKNVLSVLKEEKEINVFVQMVLMIT
jgi:hypothetical protein